MKAEIFVAAVGLAGLGLSAPAPIRQERALQGAEESVGNAFNIRNIFPRKKPSSNSSPKPSPKPSPVKTPTPPPPPPPKTTSPKNTPTPPPPVKTTTPAAPTTKTTPTTTKATPTTTSLVSTSSSSVKSSSSSTSSTASSTRSSSTSSAVSSFSSSTVSSSSALTSSSSSSSSSTASVSSSTSAGSTTSSASTTSVTSSFSSGITSGTITDSNSATITSGSSSLSTSLTDILSGSSSASLTLTTSGTATANDVSSVPTSTGTGSLSSSASGSLTSSATDSLSTTLTDSTSLTGTATTTGTETGTATSTTSSSTSTETTVKLGHGWRTTTSEERKAAKSRKGSGGKSTDVYDSWSETDACSLFDDDDGTSNSTVKARGLDARGKKKKPPPADCPTDYQGYLDIQFPSGNGIFNPVPRNGALFYSNVNQEEHNWADASGRGFTFMKESMKPESQDAEAAQWIKKHKCCDGFWALVSQAWATMVEGDVHVLLPSTPWFAAGAKPDWPRRDGKNSIWQDYEYETVLANPKACRLWRWNYDTKQADLIAVKTGATAIGCPDTYPADPQTPPAKPAGSH